MNLSNIFHALLALAAQALIGLTTGNWWAGAALGAGFYFGRGVAQYEVDQLKVYGKRAGVLDGEGMPWYEGFKVFNWGSDAQFDLIVPVAAVCIFALIVIGV